MRESDPGVLETADDLADTKDATRDYVDGPEDGT